MTIWLIRNGSLVGEDSKWPLPDDPLSERGIQESVTLADFLKQLIEQAHVTGRERKSAIFSSDHRRTMQTVEPLAQEMGCTIQIHPGLRSIDLGDYYGKSESAICGLLGETTYKEMRNSPVADREYFPNGETLEMQSKRVLAALEEIEPNSKDTKDHVIVSTHATCIQIILCTICGIPLSSIWTWRIAPALVTPIEWKDGRWFIDQVACNPH